MQAVCNPFWVALQPVRNPQTTEQPRTRANRLPPRPQFSGSFARVHWSSRKVRQSGRPVQKPLNAGLTGPLRWICGGNPAPFPALSADMPGVCHLEHPYVRSMAGADASAGAPSISCVVAGLLLRFGHPVDAGLRRAFPQDQTSLAKGRKVSFQRPRCDLSLSSTRERQTASLVSSSRTACRRRATSPLPKLRYPAIYPAIYPPRWRDGGRREPANEGCGQMVAENNGPSPSKPGSG